ncbi:hypothetical protein BKN38_09675 [Helicobacter sp. CLO-3]|nr:hypothetical protein BA723_09260 [Helicobacter sp. CLO-3]OHU81125.1 hypothetical protein BKN38_09675 [Helicobacter sp. CLO-3]
MDSGASGANGANSANTRRLKAEWEEQSAILLAFPHENSDWAAHIDEARECFGDIIAAIARFEDVLVCVDVEDTQGLAFLRARFGGAGLDSGADATLDSSPESSAPKITPFTTIAVNKRIKLAFVPTNDTWARDFGAISVEDLAPQNAPNASQNALDSTQSAPKSTTPKHDNAPSEQTNAQTRQNLRLINFVFNGWGLKFGANFDNQITPNLHKIGALKGALESHPFVLEGGSIDTDGAYSALTTSACLLEPNRNATYTKSDIERRLRDTLGIKRVLWLANGYLAGDDTDSHIDMLARFLTPDTIAYIACDDENDEHYDSLRAMEQEILALRTIDGAPYNLVRLPFVSAIYDEGGARLPASYANFLFVNGALLVPTYADKNDDVALQMLREALPNRQVIGVDARTLIRWHGSLHCVTMQLYA